MISEAEPKISEKAGKSCTRPLTGTEYLDRYAMGVRYIFTANASKM